MWQGGVEERNTVLLVSIRVLNSDLCTSRTTESKHLYEAQSRKEGRSGIPGRADYPVILESH